MPRRRWFQSLLLLAGLVAVTYLLISLYLPSSRWLIFGIDKHSGSVRMVQQRVTYLPPYQFYRLKFEKREGSAQRDGSVRITSQEGVPVTLFYRLRFGVAGDHIPDPRRVVDQGWNAWIEARIAEAVTAVSSQIPVEDLLSPTSQFNAQREPLRQTVARHLAQSGLKVTAFEIARFEVDRDALLKVKKAELRRDARSTPTRVAFFALDGADWELLSELGDDGHIPNIKALSQGGTTASVQTIEPTVSSMLWTTVATGLTPDRHGVIDFTDWSHHSPVEAYARHAPALWDIADSFGRPGLITSWWTAWPPAAQNTMFFDEPVALVPSSIQPAEFAQRVESLLSTPDKVTYNDINRYLQITPDEWQRARSSGGDTDPVNIFTNVLCKTESDHQVAINLYNDARQHGRDPLLIMVSFEGTDAVNHLFSPYHPPQREGVDATGFRKYWKTVDAYYSEVDRLIGEWMNVLPRDTTVIIASAYGFRWGKDRPRSMPNGAALSDHRNPGIFIAYGPHVAPNRGSHTMSLYDLAPTVLTLLGLPQSTEMPGKVATWAFRDITPISSVRVVSYGEFIADRPIATSAHLDGHVYQRELQAIGHLNDPSRNLTPVLENTDYEPARASNPLPPEKWGAYAYYNNLGVQLRGKGKLKEAAEAFQQAVQLNPDRPTPYLNLAMALWDRQMYTDADEAFLNAVAKGLPNAEQYFVDFAALYRQPPPPQRTMISRAIALLQKGKELFPQSYLIAANLGTALVEADRITEGVQELDRALGMRPSSTEVLNNLGLFYAKKNDYARALDYWNRSLSIEPHQPQIRQAADAARARL